jgi:hypothetical protein
LAYAAELSQLTPVLAVPGRKTDVSDARKIAVLFYNARTTSG